MMLSVLVWLALGTGADKCLNMYPESFDVVDHYLHQGPKTFETRCWRVSYEPVTSTSGEWAYSVTKVTYTNIHHVKPYSHQYRYKLVEYIGHNKTTEDYVWRVELEDE
jgi:hypothetical protein